MAAAISQTELDYTCPVCCDIFQDPVVLSCGHSFCEDCLQQCWRQSFQRACPVCRRICPMMQPTLNLSLRNLCDALRTEKSQKVTTASEEMCSVHNEKLKLFCEDDQQLICVICRDAKKHKNHNCVPINEAAETHQTEIKAQLKSLKSKLESFQREKFKRDKMASHIKLQAAQTEKTIKDEFQKLHKFLRDEEAARINDLRKEATQKSEKMNSRITELASDISALTQKITNVEKEINAEDVSFMLKLKNIVKLRVPTILSTCVWAKESRRSQCILPQPETPTEALINEAKHVGNLLFTVWRKMKNLIQCAPVTLDPNTGGKQLTISDKMTRSTTSDKSQPLPDNPERLYGAVLGSEGFISGKHSWDVEVEGDWAVAVAEKPKCPNSERVWGMYMHPSTQWMHELTPEAGTSDGKVLAKDSFPQKVRVQLDYNQGTLSFFDLDRKTNIHTVKHTFTERVFPYFRANVNILQTWVIWG